jgi:uncharacterized membrane protein
VRLARISGSEKTVLSMGSKGRVGALLLLLAWFAVTVPSAQGKGFKLKKLNPPGTGFSFAFGLNNNGSLMVGSFQDAKGGLEGFVYNWVKYKAIVFPGAVNFTRANGVNNARTVVGDFVGADTFNHGFLLNGTGFTQYDVPGVTSTSVYGINDAGNLVGFAGFNGDNQGFVDIGGTVTLFTVDGDPTYAFSINNANAVVGNYLVPPAFLTHGFSRDASGAITKIDYPGAAITSCLGINDSGEISGFYVDSADVSHGFIEKDGEFRTLRLPDIAGINNQGMFVGSYTDSNQVNYGYVALPRPAASPR